MSYKVTCEATPEELRAGRLHVYIERPAYPGLEQVLKLYMTDAFLGELITKELVAEVADGIERLATAYIGEVNKAREALKQAKPVSRATP